MCQLLGNTEVTMISDYIFIDPDDKVLARYTLRADQVGYFAQRLARKYKTDITITIIAGETATPDKCEECGEIMPESGPCWHNMFEEEESIPFDGRPMAGPERTVQDIYGLESR